ncbi:MAG: SusF/SusE family outer membrane protein [Pseudobacter sp.]|uniref:SusF/SusE family outer membrane protein n=1 Tax=Pseudobacter sp. TaxID=2045420 RepID=UPI003F7EC782
MIASSIKNWLPLLAVLLVFSCRKDYKELNKGNVPLQLSASSGKIMLNQKNDAADALVLSWTSGSNNGTNAGISYVLKIDKQGNDFKQALVEDLGKGGLSKKYSVKDLNNLLLTKWSLTPGTETSFQAKVVATIGDDAGTMDSSSVITFLVTAYKPVSTVLYLIGDATPNGWDAGNATPMSLDNAQAGLFHWQGNLSAGEFKLITTLGQFSPSYNKGGSNTTLVYRDNDADPDEKFVITESGLYDVTVNLLDLTIDVQESSEPPYKRLWMLGDAIPTGWDIQNPAEMRVDSSNLFVFTYNEILSAGEFKIPVATGNFGTDYYMPLSNNPAITEPGVQLVAGGNPDLKWKITNPGPYKIKLDILAMTVSIKPFTPFTQIWMVGDATPTGWNIDNPTPMTADPGNPYVFTWTGQMNVGEFKLPVETGDWGGDFFMPVLNASGPGSTQMKFVPGGSPDFKWKITEAGTYKITINQLYDTISIQKQ